MNGMKAKAGRRKAAARLTDRGLPRNANEWTVEDWRDLHEAIEQAIAKISARHKEKAS